MTHGDDDGLRLPPAIAPRQIVLVPMLRGKPEDSDILAFCEATAKALVAQSAFGEALRVLVDKKDIKSAEKRWNWVRRGAPLICEIGPRDVAAGNITFMRRDDLRDGDKVKSHSSPRDAFVANAPALLAEIQNNLYTEAKARLDGNISSEVKSLSDLAAYFGAASENEDEGSEFKGWVRAPWAAPTGPRLEAIEKELKALKLTIRNAPMAQGSSLGKCLFTGETAVQEVLIARAY
jgi:prolyl-tRNA synthetase